MTKNWYIRDDSGWKVTIRNLHCSQCGKANLNTKEGFFKLSISSGKNHYYNERVDICLCSDCFKQHKDNVNELKPSLLDVYDTKYKEAMVRGIERGNRK
jgi:hypothetical protein